MTLNLFKEFPAGYYKNKTIFHIKKFLKSNFILNYAFILNV